MASATGLFAMAFKRHGPSLGRRLLVAAAAFLILALIAAGVFIDGILHRFISGQIDSRLDAQLLALAAAVVVDNDGMPRLKRDLDLPPYDRALSGWYWQVNASGSLLTSRSLVNEAIAVSSSVSNQARGPAGETLRTRSRTLVLPDQAGPVTITTAAPQAEIETPLTSARWALASALAGLGAALVAAMFVQVRLGLDPLRQLVRQLHEVRAGGRRLLPTRQPSEISELVLEVNALLAQNRESIERARSHVTNLAHGLKTPLATLAAHLESSASLQSEENRRLIGLIDRRIAHHLRRARTAALSGEHVEQIPLPPRIADLIVVMSRIYEGRLIETTVAVPADSLVRCDRQDLDEMLGNLFDNAFKWARSMIAIEVRRTSTDVIISVSDDGPGLPDSELHRILERDERFDEATPGTGFGLPITCEIAALYGGKLDLGKSTSGGLTAILTLKS